MCDQQNLRSACAYAQIDQSLCWSLEYSMIVKLLTEHHLEFLSLKGGCTGSSESTLVKMPHCWKSRVVAQFNCLFVVMWLLVFCTCIFLTMLRVGMQCMIAAFPGHATKQTGIVSYWTTEVKRLTGHFTRSSYSLV